MLHPTDYAALRADIDRMWKLPPLSDAHAPESRGWSRARTVIQLDKLSAGSIPSAAAPQGYHGIDRLPLPALALRGAAPSGPPSASSQIVSSGGQLGGGGPQTHPVVENLLETAMAFRRAALERSGGQPSTSGRDVGLNLSTEQTNVRLPRGLLHFQPSTLTFEAPSGWLGRHFLLSFFPATIVAAERPCSIRRGPSGRAGRTLHCAVTALV